jgi:aspartate dehydrogenase
MTLSILMIGHGAIATWVAAQVSDDPDVRIDYVLCRPGREAVAGKAIKGVHAISDLSLLSGSVDYAVECAGHAALIEHGSVLLEQGIDLGIASIGAFSDPNVATVLERAAIDGNARIDLLSGAIGAIDALSAAKQGGLASVSYTGRKPPTGWRGSAAEKKLDLESLTSAQIHFEGSAREAAILYPKNANVAATVALAGIGLDETRVTLIADPEMTGNRHEIDAGGTFGRFSFTIDGKSLPENPKTSALTAMSVVRAIRNRAAAVRI